MPGVEAQRSLVISRRRHSNVPTMPIIDWVEHNNIIDSQYALKKNNNNIVTFRKQSDYYNQAQFCNHALHAVQIDRYFRI